MLIIWTVVGIHIVHNLFVNWKNHRKAKALDDAQKKRKPRKAKEGSS